MKRTQLVVTAPILLAGLCLGAVARAQAFPIPATPEAKPAAAPSAQPATPVAAPPAAPAASQTPPPAAAEPIWAGTVEAPSIAPPALPPGPPPNVCPRGCPAGFRCLSGRCVSACHPGCGKHSVCLETGVCREQIKPGARRHDGLLVRAAGGILSASLRANSLTSVKDLSDQTITGNLSVDVGSAVIENLIVRGRAQASIGYFDDSPFGGNVLPMFAAIGGGADYYFMPLNLYVGATLNLVGASINEVNDVDKPKDERHDHVRHSRPGFGIDLDVGKEWWVSGNWGMGIALRLRYLDMAPANIGLGRDGRLTSVQAGLMFSATYN